MVKKPEHAQHAPVFFGIAPNPIQSNLWRANLCHLQAALYLLVWSISLPKPNNTIK
jgi:hypothetical protein